jgi:SpoVK/Ycf46/Vps4 family AAA+-type ATPase
MKQRALFRVIFSVLCSVLASVVMGSVNQMVARKMFALSHTPTARSVALTEYERHISQNVVQPGMITDRLEHIGGLSGIKADIRGQVLLPLKYPTIFFGTVRALHPPRGVLFHGPPGVGKTLLARAIAAEAACPFISLTLSDLENKYFGESSKLLSATFSLARKLQPCVLFFDEIDGMIRTRSDVDQSCVYGFKTEFLTHMDGLTKQDDAYIVIGCTNCADKLDPAVRRRLPKQYGIQPPTRAEIAEILAVHLTETGLTGDEIRNIASRIKLGSSGSDLSEAVRVASAIRVKKHIDTRVFVARLEDRSTTAEDVYEMIGPLTVSDMIQALDEMQLTTAREHRSETKGEAAKVGMDPTTTPAQ